MDHDTMLGRSDGANPNRGWASSLVPPWIVLISFFLDDPDGVLKGIPLGTVLGGISERTLPVVDYIANIDIVIKITGTEVKDGRGD